MTTKTILSFDDRAQYVKNQHFLRKKQIEEEGAAQHQEQTLQQIEAILSKLEKADDINSVSISIRSTEMNIYTQKWFENRGFIFSPVYCSEDGHYYSFWKIGFAE